VSASWHQNGIDIVFVAEVKTYRKVGIFHTVDSTIEWLIDDAKRNIEEVKSIPGCDQVLIVEVKEAKNCISVFDLVTKEEKSLSDLQTLMPLAKISNENWISKYHNSKQPGDLIVHNKSEIIRYITNTFLKVDYTPEDLAKAENYTWKSVDGLQIQGWLYRPTIKPIGTIVLVHGGPTGHSEDAFDLDIQYFVSQGFIVLDPNYRGSTGFGLEFQESIKVNGWGGKEQDDIVEGIKSLIENRISEKGKVGITGTSYGGYSAWFAITHFPKEYVTAAIPICGMADLVVDYDNTRPDLRGYSEEMMGGKPVDVPEKYFNGSPINFVKNIEGELLIVQGAKDPNVSLENVKAVEVVLKNENKKYEKLIFENEGHGISKPENQKVLLSRSVEFLKRAFN
jgi:dipeptidyl aminopeptidase/acylaminoacyl peptidase